MKIGDFCLCFVITAWGIRMKKSMITACACILALGLCACGDNQTKEADSAAASTITIAKDGSIESRLVEDFGTDYSEDGLKTLIDTSITEYQKQSNASQVALKSCEKNKNGKLVVEMTFNDSNAYAGWNNYFLDYMVASEMGLDSSGIENNTQGFFAGTISDAYSAGYSLETTLNAASDNSIKESVTKSDLLSMGDNHIVILERFEDDEPIDIECYDEILYVGDGVTATGKRSANVSTTQGYGMIVFK